MNFLDDLEVGVTPNGDGGVTYVAMIEIGAAETLQAGEDHDLEKVRQLLRNEILNVMRRTFNG